MQYKVIQGLIAQKLDKGVMILDSDKFITYTFNETAAYIFNKIKTKTNEKEIISAVVKRYGIKEKRAQKDVEEIIKDLLKKKIIQKI